LGTEICGTIRPTFLGSPCKDGELPSTEAHQGESRTVAELSREEPKEIAR
jgi:hypothetical protein